MSVRTMIPVAMVSAALMTTAAFAQTGGAGGNPGAPAPAAMAARLAGISSLAPQQRSRGPQQKLRRSGARARLHFRDVAFAARAQAN